MDIRKSIVISENFFPLQNNENAWIDGMEHVLDTGFYGRMETGVIKSAANRRRVRESLAAHHASLAYWTIPAMTAEKLCLASLDKELRRRTVERMKECISDAAECDALYIGIPSGADPGVDKRGDAVKYLTDSLCQLKDTLAQYPKAALMIEPLDREVHKRQLIGPIEEAVALAKALRMENVPFYICWDSAHEALGGADLKASFELAAPYMAQFHICNAVIDPSLPLYGDYHLPPVGLPGGAGNNGFLTVEAAADILRRAQTLNGASGRELTMALEVRTPENGDGLETERQIRGFLTEVFQLVMKRQEV